MDCFGTYFTYVQSCNVTRVQSGMDCFGTYFTHVQSCNVTRVQKRYGMDCFGTCFTHVQSCNVIYRRRRRRPPVRPSASLYMTRIDVYRRRETSRDIDKIYRRRRRRPGLRPSAPPIYYMYRRRETPRDIDKIYRRRETSRDIDKIYRRRETSIKILYPYSFLIVLGSGSYNGREEDGGDAVGSISRSHVFVPKVRTVPWILRDSN